MTKLELYSWAWKFCAIFAALHIDLISRSANISQLYNFIRGRTFYKFHAQLSASNLYLCILICMWFNEAEQSSSRKNSFAASVTLKILRHKHGLGSRQLVRLVCASAIKSTRKQTTGWLMFLNGPIYSREHTITHPAALHFSDHFLLYSLCVDLVLWKERERSVLTWPWSLPCRAGRPWRRYVGVGCWLLLLWRPQRAGAQGHCFHSRSTAYMDTPRLCASRRMGGRAAACEKGSENTSIHERAQPNAFRQAFLDTHSLRVPNLIVDGACMFPNPMRKRKIIYAQFNSQMRTYGKFVLRFDSTLHWFQNRIITSAEVKMLIKLYIF